jgi:hypothetical protein
MGGGVSHATLVGVSSPELPMRFSPIHACQCRRCRAHKPHPERDAQFRHIAEERQRFAAAGEPIISVDTKKELIGDFRNPGRVWGTRADPVLVHDWPQDAIGQAIPYGIYELTTNRGTAATSAWATASQVLRHAPLRRGGDRRLGAG